MKLLFFGKKSTSFNVSFQVLFFGRYSKKKRIMKPLNGIMNKSYLILTDSGGVQEEAPSLGKPVLVMRTTTERPEAVEAGAARLVGTKSMDIVAEVENLLNNMDEYEGMANANNPYGDGSAAKTITKRIFKYFNQ